MNHVGDMSCIIFIARPAVERNNGRLRPVAMPML